MHDRRGTEHTRTSRTGGHKSTCMLHSQLDRSPLVQLYVSTSSSSRWCLGMSNGGPRACSLRLPLARRLFPHVNGALSSPHADPSNDATHLHYSRANETWNKVAYVLTKLVLRHISLVLRGPSGRAFVFDCFNSLFIADKLEANFPI